jgi:hypothetical protein
MISERYASYLAKAHAKGPIVVLLESNLSGLCITEILQCLHHSNTDALILPMTEANKSEIRVEVIHAPLDGSVPFIALSYSWKEPMYLQAVDPCMSELILDKCQTLEIGSNLAAHPRAVRHDKKSFELRLINAVCINQADILERNAEVA